jgi:hypothetical protein
LFVISSTAAGHVETHTYPNNTDRKRKPDRQTKRDRQRQSNKHTKTIDETERDRQKDGKRQTNRYTGRIYTSRQMTRNIQTARKRGRWLGRHINILAG